MVWFQKYIPKLDRRVVSGQTFDVLKLGHCFSIRNKFRIFQCLLSVSLCLCFCVLLKNISLNLNASTSSIIPHMLFPVPF